MNTFDLWGLLNLRPSSLTSKRSHTALVPRKSFHSLKCTLLSHIVYHCLWKCQIPLNHASSQALGKVMVEVFSSAFRYLHCFLLPLYLFYHNLPVKPTFTLMHKKQLMLTYTNRFSRNHSTLW